ncbi:MAG TPA: DUF2339 domain-containing protein, partial [Ramlibacter sp.]|nr:DUF2339 domain-containing protein [Ramlibacter sp.]
MVRMVLWGAVCGGVLGLLWPGWGWKIQSFIGMVLGTLAGLGLRWAVHAEIKAAVAAGVAIPRPAAAPPVPRPAAEDFPVTAPQPLPQPVPAARDAQSEPPAAAPRPRAPSPAQPRRPDLVTALWERGWAWLLGGNTVVRMGVLVLFVGLAFLAKYAVDHALLPPELRLAGIGAAGIALFAAGFRLRGKSPDKLAYALTLQGAGVAVLYLTVFAAFRLYQFLPAGAAFAALGLVCAFAAVIAVAQNAMAMAFIGFAGGFAAPILVSTGQGNHVGLFSYYLLLGVAIA